MSCVLRRPVSSLSLCRPFSSVWVNLLRKQSSLCELYKICTNCISPYVLISVYCMSVFGLMIHESWSDKINTSGFFQLLLWREGSGAPAAGFVWWVHPDVGPEDRGGCSAHWPTGWSAAHLRRGGGAGEQHLEWIWTRSRSWLHNSAARNDANSGNSWPWPDTDLPLTCHCQHLRSLSSGTGNPSLQCGSRAQIYD